MRKLRTLLVACLTAAIVVPVAAQPVFASAAHCQQAPQVVNRHLGYDRNVVNWSAYGVKAKIDVLWSSFQICFGSDDALPNANNGPSVWVGITSGSGGFTRIIQIGMIKCHSVLYSVCDGQLNYFSADGGCGIAPFDAPEPDLIERAVSAEPHTFQISREWNADLGRYYWRGRIDGVIRKSWSESYEDIDCWITGDRAAEWYGETLDAGDGVAHNNDRLEIADMRYQSSSAGAWNAINLPVTGYYCDHPEPNLLEYFCDPYESDSIHIWTEPN